MTACRTAVSIGLLINLAGVVLASSSHAQTATPKDSQSAVAGARKLTGEDYKRAEELERTIGAAIESDRWDEVIARGEELLELRSRVLGAKHFETVTEEFRLRSLRRTAAMSKEDRAIVVSSQTIHQQAVALHRKGKYAEAQPLFEQALDILRRLFTDENPTTAARYNDLAINLNAQARYTEAEALYEKALEIRRHLLTENHPDTAETYNSIGTNLHAQGKYAQAARLLEQALEIRRRLLTDEHFATAESYNNVAVNLNAQGKYAEAQPFYEKGLEILRRLLTDNHRFTAASFNNVGMNLSQQGKLAQAQPLLEKALEIRRRLLTDAHPDTALSFNNVAYNLNSQGRYAQAQPLCEKALEINRRLLTEAHPTVATGYNNLARNLNAQGTYAQAQALYEKALEIRRRLLTDAHPDTALSLNNLAITLNDQRKYIQSQPLLEKSLEIYRQLFTDDHPDTARSYNNLAANLDAQGKYTQAQPLYEKALQIRRRLLTDDHPETALSYKNLASIHDTQGRYAQAQPLYEKALSIQLQLLGDDHPDTGTGLGLLALNLAAQGKYTEAREHWIRAVTSLDAARRLVAFTGLERAGARCSVGRALAAVLARLGQPAEAWQALEEELGRGLLDDLAARDDSRLNPEERLRLRALTTELERLDRLVEATPKGLDQTERAKRFEDLKRERELASIALGEFQTKLAKDHGALAGEVARLSKIQSALPADAALISWVDNAPRGPNAADPDGDHWGVVVRPEGVPAWVPIVGTGPNGLWTKGDNALADRVRAELRKTPGGTSSDLLPLLEKLRVQRLEPLAQALGATTRTVIVLPSHSMRGIPVEALLDRGDTRVVSYAPSGTVFKYLREQTRPVRRAGLLALGDPVYERPEKSSDPGPVPDHGLLVNVVAPGSSAAKNGFKAGDVLLAYNGLKLNKIEDLKVIDGGGEPIVVEVWRDGRSSKRGLPPGKLGVLIDARPAPEAIAANRSMKKVLVAARSGDEDFAPLPGTRYEIEALARLFKLDDRPVRTLLETEASEPELDRLATSGELERYGFIHLATHGVIDEDRPTRSAIILAQTGLPDPLEQALANKPVFDGRLLVREIQHDWDLKAEMVTLSACETALGRDLGGEGFVGFTQALLISARGACVCRSGRWTTRLRPCSCSVSMPICWERGRGSMLRCRRPRRCERRRRGCVVCAAMRRSR